MSITAAGKRSFSDWPGVVGDWYSWSARPNAFRTRATRSRGGLLGDGWCVGRLRQVLLSVEQQGPQPQQRPVEFALGMCGLVAAQLAAAKRLLEMSEEQFEAPAFAVDVDHLTVAQASRIAHAGHEGPRMTCSLNHHQPQHQWGLVALGHFVGPEVAALSGQR